MAKFARHQIILILGIIVLTRVEGAQKASPPTVGMEGRLEVILPGAVLEAKPVDARSLIVLRIADSRPHGTMHYYDLRYVGLEPGQFDLRDYLVRKDASPATDLPPMPVDIAPLLPETHDGYLVPQPLQLPRSLGGYQRWFITLAGLWMAAFIPLYLRGRSRKPKPAVIAPAPTLTLVDRLKPLVEQAARGTLSRDDQAQLELLLLNHWRQKIGLEEISLMDAVSQLRRHPEAGALLRELESWLHRPPGSVQVDLEKILGPYRASAEAAHESAP